MCRKLLGSMNGFVIAGCFSLAVALSGEVIADGGVKSLHVVHDVTFDGNGKSVITPRIVTIDHQDLDRQREEAAQYEAARAALYQGDSVNNRILRNVGLLRCGTFSPGELRKLKNSRETLIERAGLILSDVQLNSLLVKLLTSEPTLTDRQVRDIFQILHEGGDEGWRSIETASSELNAIADTAWRNFPPGSQEDDVHEDLVRSVYELGEMRLRRLLEDGVKEDQLGDDISMKVLDKLAADSRIAGSDLRHEIQGLTNAVRRSDIRKRWE